MFYPMLAMVLVTFVVGLITVKVRFASVKNGEVSAKYFTLMEGEKVPEKVIKSTRCFNNQFEVPLLFYVVCTLYISLGIENNVGELLAWLFVTLRSVHAYIHLTYNHLLHRLSVFWLAFFCVIALWVNLFFTIK